MRSSALGAAAVLAAVPLFSACLDARSGDAGAKPPPHDTHATADADAQLSDTAAADTDDSACHPIGERCDDGGPCCQGFCSTAVQVYAPGICTALLPDGAFCTADGQCVSGACTDSLCGSAPACSPLGAACWDDDACCTGICTHEAGSATPGECVLNAPQCVPQGGSCTTAGECCSGQCSGQGGQPGTCLAGGPACDDQPAQCWSSFECCEGTFCSYTGFDYTPGQCLPRLGLGAWCAQDAWCASGKCLDGQCVAPSCGAPGAECASAGDCCTGLCSAAFSAYGPGACFAPLADDQPCAADAWCASGHCADGLCATPAQPATFARLWDEVLEPQGCTNVYCHGAAGAELDLSTRDAAYWNLTGRSAVTPACGAFLRVVPGHPEHSVLWLRVRPMVYEPGPEPCLPKMPHGTQGLDAATAELVEAWILQGALP